MKVTIKLKEVGYGNTEAIIVGWISDVGDMVTEEQPIVDLTCDEEMCAILSPADGIIKETLFRPGETATFDDVLGIIETEIETLRD